MSKKKKAEFKRHFYVNWFVHDWLGDPNLKLCSYEAKGFWMDLLMNMTLFFPYGHLSMLSKARMRESNIPLIKKFMIGDKAGDKPPVNPWVNPPVNPTVKPGVGMGLEIDDDIWVTFSMNLSYEQQLSIAQDLEDMLPEYLGKSPELVHRCLQELDNKGVISRTPEGIIYSRRLVRDFRKRMQNFSNGKKGGNPLLKNKSKSSQKVGDDDDDFSDNPPVNPPVNPGVKGGVGFGYNNTGRKGGYLSPSNSNSNSTSNTNSLYDSESSDDDGNGCVIGNGAEKNGNGAGEKNQGPKSPNKTLLEHKAAMLADRTFMDPLLMNTGIVPAEIDDWINLYHLNLITSGKESKDYHDYRAHFRNWLFKRDYHKKPPKSAEIQQVAKSKKDSRELLSKYV